ncbi:MAG: DnaJ domain-containing protein [Pseudomonadales bacterium]|nr:DnaJ domain-containing protein [Pseudomonadales bacterium]
MEKVSHSLQNPFIQDALRLLKKEPGELKIYDLLAGLDQQLLGKLVDTDDFNLKTFRKNFWLMNALYQLQAQLVDDDVYLSIGQVSVGIVPGGSVAYQHLVDHSEHRVRDYYLDWNNYHGTDTEAVDKLLKQFWDRYYSVDQIGDALRILGVDNRELKPSWQEIQTCYRQLARTHHPDRGGESAKFIEVREAYEVLKAHFGGNTENPNVQ